MWVDKQINDNGNYIRYPYQKGPRNDHGPQIDVSGVLKVFEDRILTNRYTKTDFDYHNIKQSLHNMWARIYHLEGSEERTTAIKKILECLTSLERNANENGQMKYMDYYAREMRISHKTKERIHLVT
ncbi:hypothetical protein NQ317_005597 [Molorchus minor]|uniref:Uncharacterized protein n=1 Tax=Molorchus minor TaxID=1323400 RepID=A0ABQ9K7V1_9CUCU|nr:hypothetical protein NQ317_005597 [Molorchus minor]